MSVAADKPRNLGCGDLFDDKLIAEAAHIEADKSNLTVWFVSPSASNVNSGELVGLKYVRRIKDWRIIVDVYGIVQHSSGTTTQAFWTDLEPAEYVQAFWSAALTVMQCKAFGEHDGHAKDVSNGLRKLLDY